MRRPRVALAACAALLTLLPSLARAQAPGGPAPSLERVAAGDRVRTAVAVAQRGWPDGAATVLLASGHDPVDALAAGPLAAAEDAPILLTAPDHVAPEVLDELRRLDPQRVVLLGGPAAIGAAVEAAVRGEGHVVERVAGEDRAATAARIARRLPPTDGGYTVASGDALTDAVAGGSLAVTGAHPPLLLVTADAVPPVTRSALAALGAPEELHGRVVGGPAVVGEAVAAELPGDVERLAGPTRYETSQAVAAAALAGLPAEPRPLVVAGGEAPADAVVAAPLAARLGGVLLLLPPDRLPASGAAFLAAHRERLAGGVLVGGAAALSPRLHLQVERVLEGLPSDPPPEWVPQVAPAVAVAAARAGEVSFAVIGTDGVVVGHRPERTVPIASVLKVMLMAAHLNQPDVRDRDLTRADLDLLEPMIRASADAPATVLADRLGPGPVLALAAEAGMQDFSWTRPWGSSRTSARDQAPFLLHLDRHVPPRHAATALRLLTEVVPEQRWGIGEVPTPGWTAHFKGGWGSGTGAVAHQVAMLEHCTGVRVALAVMTTSSPSHAHATDTVREVIAALLADLPRGGC